MVTGQANYSENSPTSHLRRRFIKACGLTKTQRLPSYTNHPPQLPRGAGEQKISRKPETNDSILTLQQSANRHRTTNASVTDTGFHQINIHYIWYQCGKWLIYNPQVLFHWNEFLLSLSLSVHHQWDVSIDEGEREELNTV